MSKKKTNSQANTAPAVTGKVYGFCSKKKMILTIAICVVLALVAGIIIRGVHLAIEFKGGTLITYTYDGDKYSFVETNSYPDVISSRRTHKMLIDPNNPFEYVYKGKKYDDVFNTCDLVGVLLFALAIFFYRLTRVRFKSYI